ncbi:BTAD domain-containing putative transcriptional regulator [Asanoa sp. NPDC049573]|uniref:BTAD domain-containing putative transcriptional regulator n=1 Tax=Asanoa sp. NPDC049573 TaxID=3155396 RepID=UPI00342353B2
MSTNFATQLRLKRQDAGLTQRELATRAGVSVAVIRDLEQGRTKRPQPRSVEALARALSLHPVLPPRPAPPRVADSTSRPVIQILGPLTVRYAGWGADLGGPGPRTVLGRLALSPGRPVPRAELIDLLWPGEDPPVSAVNLVQTYVSRLRRALGPAGLVNLVPGGYQLAVSAEHLDALRFGDLLREARGVAPLEPERAGELLDQALALWRGDPLADLVGLAEHPAVVTLSEERLSAGLLRADVAGARGEHELAVRLLWPLADRHPLHEPLHARLMLALAAAGRQAEALETYERIRVRLAEQLGVDPGPELSGYRQRVLRQQWRPGPGRPTVPFQVPAPPADFTGRAGPLHRVQRMLDRSVVCAISGVGGAGKTALAAVAAARLRTACPDGQLFVDLRGSGPAPLPPVEALGSLLRALGVDGDLPADVAERAGLYRSMLADRRVLVVVDDARDAAQVRHLLPGPGRCGALVTSRRRLVDLAGAQLVDLELLSCEEAVELLGSVAGPARVGAEPQAAAALVAACGLLPLAVRIAGVRLASRPGWRLDAFARRLADGRLRLDELCAGDLDVRATFQLSYAQLAPPDARAFRLLALAPGALIGLTAAAALLGLDPITAERGLDALVGVNLLQRLPGDRFTFHNLLRLYAIELAGALRPTRGLARAS